MRIYVTISIVERAGVNRDASQDPWGGGGGSECFPCTALVRLLPLLAVLAVAETMLPKNSVRTETNSTAGK